VDDSGLKDRRQRPWVWGAQYAGTASARRGSWGDGSNGGTTIPDPSGKGSVCGDHSGSSADATRPPRRAAVSLLQRGTVLGRLPRPPDLAAGRPYRDAIRWSGISPDWVNRIGVPQLWCSNHEKASGAKEPPAGAGGSSAIGPCGVRRGYTGGPVPVRHRLVGP
jgi:hypothetical protein